MPTQIHELKGVMTAESRGLADGLELIARFAERAAEAWDRAATRIDGSVTRIEAALNRGTARFEGFSQTATNTANVVSSAAAQMATAWNAAVGSMRAPQQGRSTGGGAVATVSMMPSADDRAAAAQQRLAERQASLSQRTAEQQAAAANRAQHQADRQAAADLRAAERQDKLAYQSQAAAIRSAEAWDSAKRRMITSAGDVASAWSDAFNKMLSAATRVTAVVGGTVAALGGTLIAIGTKFNDTVTRSELALTKLTGSGNIAAAMLEDLKRLSIESPLFKFTDLAPLAQSLINAKFAAKDVVPLIGMIGDQVAAMGGTQMQFDRIVLAITQIKGKGRFLSQEATQLAEAGISPWQAIADAMRRDVAEVRKMAELGQIDAQTALAAIFKSMEAAKGSSKALAATTIGGLMSALSESIEQWAGQVTAPIYNLMRTSLSGLIDALSNQAFTDVVYAQFVRLSNALQSLFDSFGGDPWEGLADGARRLTTILIDLIGTFQRMLPDILAAGRAVGSVLEWFAKLALESPRVTAALVAFQITGLLGINSALFAVGKALMSTIGWLTQLATGTTTATGAFQALASAAGMSQMALGGLVAIAAAAFLYELVDALADLNAQLTKATELQEKFKKATESQTKAGIERAAAAGGEDQVRMLEEQLAAADKRSQDARKAQDAAQKKSDAANRGWFNATEREIAAANLAEVKSVATAAEEQYAAVKAELDRVQTQRKAEAGKAEMAGISPEVQAIIGEGPDPAAAGKRAAKQAKIDEALASQRQKEIAKDAKSYDELNNFLDLEPTEDELRRFAATLPGFTQEIIDNLVKVIDEAKAESSKNPEDVRAAWLQSDISTAAEMAAKKAQGVADRTAAGDTGKDRFTQSAEQLQLSGAAKAVSDTAASVFRSLQSSLADDSIGVKEYDDRLKALTRGMQSIVSVNPEDIQKRLSELSTSGVANKAFQAEFGLLQQNLLNGKITVAQFKDGIGALEKNLQTAGQAEQQFQSILDGVGRNLPVGAVQQLKDQFFGLQNALISGAMGLDEFKEKMRELDEQARMADLQRRASGQFTPEEFQKALLERAAGIQQQQFGQRVDEAIVQQLLNAGMSLETIAKLMGKLPDKFDRMINQQKAQTQTVDSGWAQRTATFYSWLSSFDGQVTSLRNQIAMMSQNLAPGVLDTTRERLRYVDEINKLNQQLNALLAPRTPIVRQTEADFLRDPNLGNNAGGTVVNVTMPQMRVDSASVAYEIGNAIASEQRRRGAAAYN